MTRGFMLGWIFGAMTVPTTGPGGTSKWCISCHIYWDRDGSAVSDFWFLVLMVRIADTICSRMAAMIHWRERKLCLEIRTKRRNG